MSQEYYAQINQLVEETLSKLQDESYTKDPKATIPYLQSPTAATNILSRLRRLKLVKTAIIICTPPEANVEWQVTIIRDYGEGMEGQTIVTSNHLAFAICTAFLQSMGVEVPELPAQDPEKPSEAPEQSEEIPAQIEVDNNEKSKE